MACNHQTLSNWFSGCDQFLVACSGGIDSLLLATLAHRKLGTQVCVVHAVSPAVPKVDTERVYANASREGWNLKVITSGEFEDERYLSNPQNRCFYCKSHLYGVLEGISKLGVGATCVVSGANQDDLGEYRPGLQAAANHGVRHPYVELGIGKQDIRAMAHQLGLDFADLPASPCLASRLYTGTRVTHARLNFVNSVEQLIRQLTGCQVVRCRIDGTTVRIEVPETDRNLIDDTILKAIRNMAIINLPEVSAVILDAHAYAPGRAFVAST